MADLTKFKFWCQKVLPLVYDDSLSYYEVLCKVVDYLNNIIEGDISFVVDVEEIKQDIAEIKEWIANFNEDEIREMAEQAIEESLAAMIWVDISTNGYIVYHIPNGWSGVVFNTAGVDIDVPDVEYGTLILTV